MAVRGLTKAEMISQICTGLKRQGIIVDAKEIDNKFNWHCDGDVLFTIWRYCRGCYHLYFAKQFLRQKGVNIHEKGSLRRWLPATEEEKAKKPAKKRPQKRHPNHCPKCGYYDPSYGVSDCPNCDEERCQAGL